jgi:molybdate transport system substrate-binding protein
MMIRRINILVTIMLVFLSACGSSTAIFSVPSDPPGSTALAGAQPTLSGKSGNLVVFAAASLSGAFKEIGKTFEAANPGVRITFNFAGSQILRTQLEQGASADVFAAADHKNMDGLVSEKLIGAGGYQDFATNQLVVIMPKDNPAYIQSLSDLTSPGLKLILADKTVPAGNYARQLLEKMNGDPAYGPDFSQKVLANLVSNETDVKQVVAKVELGEGDAGIVYITDAMASPDLQTIPIPGQFNIIARYPIATLLNAPNPELAQVFVAYVTSTSGQEILKKWGFGSGTP